MDLKYCKSHYATDYKCACFLAYYLLTHVIANSKQLKLNDKEILMGMLPGGNHREFTHAYGEFFNVAYQTDYFNKLEPLPKCKELGFKSGYTQELKGIHYVRKCHVDNGKIHCKEVPDGTWVEYLRSLWNLRPGDGKKLVWLTFHSPAKFDNYIKTEDGQILVKNLTSVFIRFAIRDMLFDIGKIIVIAVLLGMIDGAAGWLESLQLPSWILNPLLSLIGTGKSELNKQLELSEEDLEKIGDEITANNALLRTIFNNALSGLKSTVNTIQTNVSNIVSNTLNGITPIVNNMIETIKGKITNVTESMKSHIDKVINNLTGKVTQGNKELETKIDKFVNGTIDLNIQRLFGG